MSVYCPTGNSVTAASRGAVNAVFVPADQIPKPRFLASMIITIAGMSSVRGAAVSCILKTPISLRVFITIPMTSQEITLREP